MNSNSTRNPSGKTAFLGVMTAAALLLYSLAGAVCAFAAMVLAKRLKLFSVIGVSVLGGVCHNLGQLLVAVAVLGSSWAGWYLPWLMLAGCVTGIFIGVCAGAVNRALPPQR